MTNADRIDTQLPEQSGQDRRANDQARTAFYKLARQAIGAGLLTTAERDTICRAGHRKQRYWLRHLADLKALLDERQAGR